METAKLRTFLVIVFGYLPQLYGQDRTLLRGPWRLAFKVVGGKWDSAQYGDAASFWELFTSDNTYVSQDPVRDQRDFTTDSNHFKSSLVEDWQNKLISVQAIKLSFFKNNTEQAFIVFDGVARSKANWFECSNILYSSYTDLGPDNTLGQQCPGSSSNSGFPLTVMRDSYWSTQCAQTTAWTLVVDANVVFSVCPDYAPVDDSVPKPYFKYSKLKTVAGDLASNLELADSIGIFFQVWDMVFKGIEAIKPADGSLAGLTDLYESPEVTENDNSDSHIRNLIHVQSSKTFKSGVINAWEEYHIDMVKFSMLKSGEEKAYVTFDGLNTNSTTWFDPDRLFYSSYGNALDDADLAVCSIDGDMNRNWQIQSVAVSDSCSAGDQRGWMLVKEPGHNGTCEWDNSRKKPYFLYNTGTAPANPSLFQYADVMAVFVHGWRLVYKISAGGTSGGPGTNVYDLWTTAGAVNGDYADARSLVAGSPAYRSDVIDTWDTVVIHAVKLAAYMDGQEVFHAVFDATAGSNLDWLTCDRLLYTSVPGLDRQALAEGGYTCSIAGDDVFRFVIGKDSDCTTVSTTGVLAVLDADSACSNRTDLPQILVSNTMDETLTDSSEAQFADTFAIFVDMENCQGWLCQNGGTCQDIAGNFRCFCTGLYYGDMCSDLDGSWGLWSEWSSCSVTCGDGVLVRTRECEGTEGAGRCEGEGREEQICTNAVVCIVDGGFTEWSDWSTCSKSCDFGNQSRSRTCTNPAPQNGGADCDGESEETQDCNAFPCPIDGGFTEWSNWSPCSHTCGTGSQSRSRDCTNPAPQHGGAECDGEFSETMECNTQLCPIDGGFTEWSIWTDCPVTCGNGSQSRSRECTNPIPQHGGANCSGEPTETIRCNTDPCPIDGGYTEWTGWGTCSQTCATGTQSRTRDCTNPAPQHGGANCVGESIQNQICNTQICPIDGGFTEWTEWGTCTLTCGAGDQSRSRDCSNPVPRYEGLDCVGERYQSQTCNSYPCPVDGGFSEWTSWGLCTRTCGTGNRLRIRDCTAPAPQHGGRYCLGPLFETHICNVFPCPIDGDFTRWTDWSICTQTCGTGNQSRSRECTSPAPQYGGRDCDGDSLEHTECNTTPCPVNGSFTEWTEWTVCTQTCGTGCQDRSRECTDPAPQHGGAKCEGRTYEVRECNTQHCPIDGGFTVWTTWGECTRTCGTGSQSRSRDCSNPVPQHDGIDCAGNSTELRDCNTELCPIDGGFSKWTGWSVCTQVCGWGIQLRSRGCTSPAPQHGGAGCKGDTIEIQNCNLGPCPIDGSWSIWSDWGQCSKKCGLGNQTRSRDCDDPAPQHGGAECDGEDTQTATCNDIPCPVDGTWSDWSYWTACTASCGGGTHERTRVCDGPFHGGNPCDGEMYETGACNTDKCPPVDGIWSSWTDWSTCTKTCGDGLKVRVRNCSRPQHGGEECSGHSLESVLCKLDKCPVDGVWLLWTRWTPCTESCGGGIRGRERSCTPPQYGGRQCQGHPSEVSVCNAQNCPAIDGGWTDWEEWSECTKTCATGDQSRSRSCTDPVPEWGGQPCAGNHGEFRYCNEFECPIDGAWSDWSAWTSCMNMTHSRCNDTCTCGQGRKSHQRLCNNPPPRFEGRDCDGEAYEEKICNIPCADFQCDPNNPENCQVKNRNGADASAGTNIILIVMATTFSTFLIFFS